MEISLFFQRLSWRDFLSIIRSKSFCKKTYANLDIARDYK